MAYLKRASLQPTTVVSWNTIEHIYDMGAFLDSIAHCSEGPLSLVLGTAVTPLNPIHRRRFMALQRRKELVGEKPVWGHKERDSIKPYRELRKEIVGAAAPHLKGEEVQELAARTRGQAREDIVRCVEEYTRTGKLPAFPEHPTNTCDPLTGNWAERLMDPFALAGPAEAAWVWSSRFAGVL